VGHHWANPIKGFARGGDLNAAPAAHRFLLVLTMEIAMSRRQTKGAGANSSNSASTLVKPRSPSIWQGTGGPYLKAARRSSTTTLMGSPQWISSSFGAFWNLSRLSSREAEIGFDSPGNWFAAATHRFSQLPRRQADAILSLLYLLSYVGASGQRLRPASRRTGGNERSASKGARMSRRFRGGRCVPASHAMRPGSARSVRESLRN